MPVMLLSCVCRTVKVTVVVLEGVVEWCVTVVTKPGSE